MKKMLAFSLTIIFLGCSRNEYVIAPLPEQTIYQYLPEDLIAVNDDGTITARYVDPTYRYDHGILGDKIEAVGLLVVKNMKSYYFRLDTGQVFEDLKPRMKDIDNDGQMEFVTIQTSLSAGASVCVYKIINSRLEPFVQGGYIGKPYR